MCRQYSLRTVVTSRDWHGPLLGLKGLSQSGKPPVQYSAQQSVARLDAAPASRITLAAPSSRHKLNRDKLDLGFKQSFGISIHEYQTETRMQAALHLLRTTDIPISDIGARVGYEEPTNSTASFKSTSPPSRGTCADPQMCVRAVDRGTGAPLNSAEFLGLPTLASWPLTRSHRLQCVERKTASSENGACRRFSCFASLRI